MRSGKPIYQKYHCFRYDDLTSGGVKIDDPCFWSTGSTSSTAPGWFSNQRIHTATMPWTTICLSPVGDAMCASSTFAGLRRIHTFVRGVLCGMLQVHCPFLKERARGTQAHMSVAPLQCLPNAKDRSHEAASRGMSWSTQDTVLEMQTLP